MGLIAAAVTIVLHRDSRGTPEILLVHRNPELPVQGGIWAFPGGRIDPRDGASPPDLQTARNCAVRELTEETGLRLQPAGLQPAARWITPEPIRPRFDTWIFCCEASSCDVRVDGREIVGHAWLTAESALQAHHHGRLQLSPPAFVMLSLLDRTRDERRTWPLDEVLQFKARLVESPQGRCAVYEGDSGYPDGDLERPGSRHRLWMRPGAWRYERRLDFMSVADAGGLA